MKTSISKRFDRFGLSPVRGSVIVCLAASALYIHTLSYGFVYDDGIEIVRNGLIRSLLSLPQVFLSPVWNSGEFGTYLYRPLAIASYAFNYSLTGLQPWSYHLVNLLLHAVASVLVFRLALQWSIPAMGALVAALAFAAHPVHVEVVANVVGRKDLLAAIFVLGVLLTHSRALRRGKGYLLVPPACYLAAMLSKENGAVALGFVLIEDLIVLRGRRWRESSRANVFLLYSGYLFAIVAYLVLRWSAIGRFNPPLVAFLDNPAAHAPTGIRLFTATALVGRGLSMLALPTHFSPDYSFDAIPLVYTATNLRFAAALAAIVALAVLGLLLRKSLPAVTACVACYFLGLLPTANLVMPVGSIFAERWLYIPSIAACLLLGVAYSRLTARLPRVPWLTIAIIVVLFLSANTVRYSTAWADELQLFSWAVRAAPRSLKAHSKLGDALLTRGRAVEAIESYQRAAAIGPNFDPLFVKLGTAYIEAKQPDAARQSFRHALDMNPENADALYGLGLLHRDAGELDQAAALWHQALRVDATHPQSLADLGVFYGVRGDLVRAETYFERAVRSDPAQANAWFNLGLLRQQRGDVRGSRLAFQEFLSAATSEYAAQREHAKRMLKDLPR